MNDQQIEMEKRSAAVSLSDMEIFVFPEIMYSLVLANIISPEIWAWLDDPWFADIDQQKPPKKLQRLRQYIMDNFSFNLDLDTWGLTTREKELQRFNDFIDPEILRHSNALFGYEGDKYYFDMDIRRHFGLDKYTDETIPYWKTETVEAMTAFRYKDGYNTGAGECVSLAALWAAALFIVCKIPLEDIFMLATPLHSQNILLQGEGTITNNRRIVTRNMWVNGTELSAKARRALEKERVTIVSHVSGYIHIMYDEATIDPGQYKHFSKELGKFLHFHITPELLCNFIRWQGEYMTYFQVERNASNRCGGFIPLERLFTYEHGSNYSVSTASRKKLFDEVDCEEYFLDELEGRILLNDFEHWLRKHRLDPAKPGTREELIKIIPADSGLPVEQFVDGLINFCYVRPRLPEADAKQFNTESQPIKIDHSMTRHDIRDYLLSIKDSNKTAEYTFYALRDMTNIDPLPFVKAAIERNPASVNALKDSTIDQAYNILKEMTSESIYAEEYRLAQPDEVWNYRRGDGLEKAILLANLIRNRGETGQMTISLQNGNAILETSSGTQFEFPSTKIFNGERLVIC